MKHGPIALLSDGVPVIAIATRSKVFEKVLSNIEETKARRGRAFIWTAREQNVPGPCRLVHPI